MRGKAPKRKMMPDPRYQSTTITKLIHYIMRRGKKSVAQKVIYDCFDIIKEKTSKDPLDIFAGALKNVAPDVEVKAKRVGGGNYQIPIPVHGDRKNALAFRWLINAARSRKGVPMSQKLADELMAAYNKEGSAVKKRDDTYRMAEANRAFAHFVR